MNFVFSRYTVLIKFIGMKSGAVIERKKTTGESEGKQP